MDIKTQLTESMKDAMKSGDKVRKLHSEHGACRNQTGRSGQANRAMDDLAVVALIQKEIKNRREAIEEAKKANRPDLIEENEAEIKVLEVFLPQAMPAEELRALVQAAIAETGASAPSDMGKVMKIVMPKVAGRAPNDMISSTVKELLTK